jgi:hypothetical protein
MKIGKSKSILFALGMGVLAWPSTAGAVTFVQTSDHCSTPAGATQPGCGTVGGNRIEVTPNAQTGLTTFTVTLANNWAFVNTGANGGGGSLNFGFVSPLANLLVTNTSGNGWITANGSFFVQGGTPNNGNATSTVSTSLIQAPDGVGNTFNFLNGIAITCQTTGSSNACSTPLSFTINTLVALAADTSGGAFFWADVINNNRTPAPTGLIDFSPVPLPAALPLFATGLGALGLLGWRRKKKAASLAA